MKLASSTYAFLGTSPSMSLVVSEAKSLRKCVVFNSGRLGGAWAEIPLGDRTVALACNGIGSCSDGAEYFQALEQYLTGAGAQLLGIRAPLPGREPEGQDSYLVGRIMPAVEKMVTGRNVRVVPREVKEVDIYPTQVIIDGDHYSGVFLPEHFKLKSLKVMGQELKLSPNTIQSKHLRASFSRQVSGPYYDVDWDAAFDRAGVQYPSSKAFVGRVRTELKDLGLKELLRSSEWLADKTESMVDCDLNYYDSHWFSADDLAELRGRLEGTTSSVVPTQDICKAFAFSKTLRIPASTALKRS